MAYSRMAWGLALELIDFRLGTFDLLPDVIGYGLLVLGLSGAGSASRPFAIGRMAAIALMLWSLPRFVGLQPSLSLLSYDTFGAAPLLLASAEAMLELAMLYGICEGIRLFAIVRENRVLARSARNGWRAVFGFSAAFLFLLPFKLNVTSVWLTAVVVLLVIGLFIACARVIFLVRRAGHVLNDGDGGPRKSSAA
ncbi:hypothetical protein ACFPVX_00140 [Cohnella faecalis]|uniref:Uncharacterized protein n=1 Tax=Cohnella faecalis TaxID=2315694 RepID=A0A398CIQ6_9BACL|nr:hypothetical protein [Cohnella faecalis]RIE02265.1 hypothetical protein D3H35_16165 [Cohnella faecalis]